MNTETLLRAVRPLFLLVPRPGQSASTEPKFWSMRLDGLHHVHLKNSAKALRDARKRPGQPVSDDPSLHLSSLRHGLAQALGGKTFDAWQHMTNTVTLLPSLNWVAIDVARYSTAVLIEAASGQKHRFRMPNSAGRCCINPV